MKCKLLIIRFEPVKDKRNFGRPRTSARRGNSTEMLRKRWSYLFLPLRVAGGTCGVFEHPTKCSRPACCGWRTNCGTSAQISADKIMITSSASFIFTMQKDWDIVPLTNSPKWCFQIISFRRIRKIRILFRIWVVWWSEYKWKRRCDTSFGKAETRRVLFCGVLGIVSESWRKSESLFAAVKIISVLTRLWALMTTNNSAYRVIASINLNPIVSLLKYTSASSRSCRSKEGTGRLYSVLHTTNKYCRAQLARILRPMPLWNWSWPLSLTSEVAPIMCFIHDSADLEVLVNFS